MIFTSVHRATLLAAIFLAGKSFAQAPFQFPTANHALYESGADLKFLAPTTPDRPATSGSFGCVRNDGWRMHEGLDIRSLEHDKHGEPTDPVKATAEGTVAYFSNKPGLSNYGRYVVLQHQIDGLEIYSLYAHLSAVGAGLTVGHRVAAGEVIGTMGRSSSAETILKERAHVHFELNLFLNDHFAAWFKKNAAGERNDHGNWNGQNLLGLDPLQILQDERPGEKKFNLATFVRSQTELCRVQVRATTFPFLKHYPALVLKNSVAEKQGIAGYEIALNYNGVPFALLPRAESEMKGHAKIQLLSVNSAVAQANPCRKLVKQTGSHWQLGDHGLKLLDLLLY